MKNPLPASEVDDAVTALGDLSVIADYMHPLADILDHFPTTPPRRRLHLIMQVPSKSFSAGFNSIITLRLHANLIAARKSFGLIRKLSADTFSMQCPWQVKSITDYLKMMSTASLLPNEKKKKITS